MKLIKIEKKNQIKQFVLMADKIYKSDENYVPYMHKDLMKTLKKLLFVDKSYVGLMIEDEGKIIARLVYTISRNKHKQEFEKSGFFALYECTNSQLASNMMFDFMVKDLKKQGVNYLEGPFFCADPDNRRGMLINEFNAPPIILTSYNPPYYANLIEGYGFSKSLDTFSYKIDLTKFDYDRYVNMSFRVQKMLGITIKSYENNEENLRAIEYIMREASTETNYQEAPSMDLILQVANELSSFVDFDFIKLAYRTRDMLPIGFVMSVPDLNQVFKRMKGKTNIFSLIKGLRYRKKINSMRGILQYVIPAYQGKGVLGCLYTETFKTAIDKNMCYIEAGTIVENNVQSNNAVKQAGGQLYRIYRLYGLEI